MGRCFFGAFAYTAWALWRLRDHLDLTTHPTLYTLRTYLLAMVVALAARRPVLSHTSLHPIDVPDLRACAAYFLIVEAAVPVRVPRLSTTLVIRLTLLSGLFLFGHHLFTTVLVKWS